MAFLRTWMLLDFLRFGSWFLWIWMLGISLDLDSWFFWTLDLVAFLRFGSVF